ncbi:MAG TPA: DciA family protein [Saprospiraceae bacterium]|nr:DUF721 domain-containing protein [Saprospiraceae bacterium]MCB9328316.1 DUF721 domain-containing protein [Lewinellaceae bacterium]HPK10461.1 DciA family protein [Saprospiraceae bacterium]HPQ22476.1 DciA family protein [Saprospiraceae bacterium]HRX28525.1 DciA family protein [Saprospiraceae bacterium]
MKKHNDRPIGESISEALQRNQKLNFGLDKIRVENAYKKAMGDMINKYTSRVGYKNGELKMYITSASLKKELSMNADKIKDLLNDYMKKKLIESVKIY